MKFVVNVVLMLALLSGFLFYGEANSECLCGDADCDGQETQYDGMYILEYLFGGGPPPLTDDIEWANWDNHEQLTIGDVYENFKYIFGSYPPPECPPANPPLDPVVDSSMILYYTDWIPSGSSSAVLLLTLHTDADADFYGMSFPLKIRVDEEIPTIDSVYIFYYYDDFADYTIYPESGYVAIGIVPFFGSPEGKTSRVAHVYVTVPPEPVERSVTMEWVNLAPVQAPIEDTSVIPMIYRHPGAESIAVEPILEPHCCLVPGDADMNRQVTIEDAVHVIQCIFADCLMLPCEKHLDANCDGVWNIADVVYLVEYIFKVGPPPCCR